MRLLELGAGTASLPDPRGPEPAGHCPWPAGCTRSVSSLAHPRPHPEGCSHRSHFGSHFEQCERHGCSHPRSHFEPQSDSQPWSHDEQSDDGQQPPPWTDCVWPSEFDWLFDCVAEFEAGA